MVVQSHHRSTTTTDIFGDPIDSQPLWLKKNLFHQSNFDSETYITDLRTFVPLENLSSELRSHLSSLKHELLELINRDYADFVNLSTKLVDVEGAILRMRAPLTELREKIEVFRGSVEASLGSLQNGLRQREEAANAREILELMLDTFHVVSKVEKLIKELPSVPSDWSNGDVTSTVKSSLSNGASLQYAENGTNIRETQSMLLERIASEMNRLKFYIANGQCSFILYVMAVQNLPFIENMAKRIQSANLLLDASLGCCFMDGLKHRDANVIYNCLRAYAAIDNTAGAEEIFRTTVVSPLVQQIIPHSYSDVVVGASGDGLEDDYKNIMKFVEKDCVFLLDISSTANSGLHVFDFLANSILKEVLFAIQKGKPRAFTPGRPKEFLKNYKSSLAFLAYLEGYYLSRSTVTSFRSGDVCKEFLKQWNIEAYFSIRFQDIAKALDSSLMLAALTPVQNSISNEGHSQELTLQQSVIFLESLRSCWREDVFVLSCSDKFLRLSLQLMSRYSTWLSSLLGDKKDDSKSKPGPIAPEDFVYVVHDINCLVKEVNGDYLEQVLQLLSGCSVEVLDQVKYCIFRSGNSLENVVPSMLNTLIESLIEKSAEDLRQVKGIIATYRMTNKPLPVRHSPYVSGVLRPFKAFLEGERATRYLTSEVRNKLILSVTEGITSRYYNLASEVVDTTRKTASSLQRLRKHGVHKRGEQSSDVSDLSNDKICMQLFLDVQEYGRNLAALGVTAANISDYCLLWQCVAPADRQTVDNFST
ncbi:hypothetical protein GIB67_002828 [Kingdonia uniflora]|uniref:Conserved oligomeric Golgi complex subunit 2 n=1 Tax=Kingdonia uniflora TaxID=39325 RepID=A0A7J7M5A7_9MAGN|nr:hypothetical protein GIB67_002828 [Kingdonia uniflora]